ncbi:protein tyrosine phosphatase [mine drainage metagenome]|uniref:Protein tyrosine phosphatase n=1 Tax=mine drainage metagenome TaxID=410659 RepID=T0Z9E7_9ZZZZ
MKVLDDRMKVLFICKGNVGRSQMAEAFYNKFSKSGPRAISAGAKNYYYRTAWHSRIKASNPGVNAMREEGIDLTKQRISMKTISTVARLHINKLSLGRS